jgi:methyl-accepting chemotaxis protein
MTRTIRARLLQLGLTGLATTLVAITAGFVSIQSIGSAHHRSVRLASLLGEVMTADMMHDAIRGDALNALLQSGTEDLSQVQKDVDEHVGTFKASIATLSEIRDTAIRAQVARVLPAIERYGTSGSAIVAAAKAGREAAELELPRFQEDFEFLETEMARLADLVDAAAHQENELTESVLRNSLLLDIALGVLAAGLLLFLSLRTARNVSVPLERGVEALEAFAAGDLTRRVERSPLLELDRMALALNGAIERQAEALRSLVQVAQGTGTSSRKLGEVSATLESGAASAARKVGSALEVSGRLGQLMEAASGSASRSSDEIRSVATAVEEMSATAGEIARGAEETRQATSASVAAAAEASGRVDELSNASKEINRVVEVIMEIAEQTKLLALNATIEAARAGEAGKGFAVVADEVKSLARSTSEATEDIRKRIETIQSSTAVAVDRIGGIRRAIETSDRVISGIASAVQEQSATNHEIARSLARAAEGIRQATDSVQSAHGSAREIARECSELHAESASFSSAARTVRQESLSLVDKAAILDRQASEFRLS